jgi:hypothetical protein
MTKITITKYIKSKEDIEVTFPFYTKDLSLRENGCAYNEYTMLFEDGRSIEVTEDIDTQGTTYFLEIGKKNVAREIGHIYDETRTANTDRPVQCGEDEFAEKLEVALKALQLCVNEAAPNSR